MKDKLQRLNDVYQSSRRISIDDHSRWVFFSDVHRGDNSWADEFAHNKAIYRFALEYYFRTGYTYVEVGDGDELLKMGSYGNIHTAHREIFLLLNRFFKEGKYLYIFGNHDRENAFPGQAQEQMQVLEDPSTGKYQPIFQNIEIHEGLVLKVQPGGGEIFVTHGHQGELFNDHLWVISRFLLRYIWRPLQLLGIQDPTRVATNPRKRERVEKELVEWVQESGIPLLCGHTHIANLPKPGAPAYFNAGSCVHPRWISCLEILDGVIQLVKWQVKTNPDGSLVVDRDISGVPIHLSSLFLP